MGQQFNHIKKPHREFIEKQKMFFVGTATDDSKVNISPKGMDSFRVVDANRIVWLNVTGSGNETAAHIQSHPRMTIMFAAFAGAPMILRLYGTADAVHVGDAKWQELYGMFPDIPGARQVFDMRVEMVQTSCGMAVPLFDYLEDRNQLRDWADNKGEQGVREYWEKKNQTSLDGIPTGILDRQES